MQFKTPPRENTADGKPRRVGFELEFSGLTLDQAAEQLCHTFGGRLDRNSSAELSLQTDKFGTFNIELDWDYLKRKAKQAQQQDEGHEWVEFLHQAASHVVPLEIVCPPIALDQLDELNPLVAALRSAGAKGTDDSLIAAYGVHINPELPDLEINTIDHYLKAFALLQWWLVEAHEVDPARKLSPYVDLYPEPYLEAVLTDSAPTIDTVFDRYLKHNPTRNRALDLLPLLAEIDQARVRQTVDDPKIKARPTFHYRLPNCMVEQDDWSLASSWNLWCVVEQLAADPDAIATLSARFLDRSRPLIGVSRSSWQQEISQWLNDRGWA
ncbi:amidoligase family protein [Motiliproteus sediminis]|uniref:amidoligase family protein n=1 Tax=Motiliproteus sediminis TaxID=1468178 RepID=UPI001AF02275|nr:amidoligase family protein [Motiliproteus sediminis]